MPETNRSTYRKTNDPSGKAEPRMPDVDIDPDDALIDEPRDEVFEDPDETDADRETDAERRKRKHDIETDTANVSE